MDFKSKISLRSKSLLSTVELRIESKDFFFLLASHSSGDVKIVESLTDFGDAVYLEIGAGDKTKLMMRARTFLEEHSSSLDRAS